MRQLLAEFPNITVIGEADHVDVAAELINTMKPDLIFLDVQMPSKSGFELLELLNHAPYIIFVTAYDEFAVHAFEVNAIDYLLKPVLPERLRLAIERVEGRLFPQTAPWPSATSDESPAPLTGEDLIKIETDRSFLMRPILSIVAVQAEGDYSRVFLPDRNLLLSRTMNEWEQLLPNAHFSRLDRSLIINLQQIDSLEHVSRNHGNLQLNYIKNPIPLGRTALKRLRLQLAD